MIDFKIPEKFDSKFRFILVSAARAKQLLNMAPSKLEPSFTRYHKPHIIAIKEVAEGLIDFEILDDEEEEEEAAAAAPEEEAAEEETES